MAQSRLSTGQLIQLLEENNEYPPVAVNLLGQIRARAKSDRSVPLNIYNEIMRVTDPAIIMSHENIGDITLPLIQMWKDHQVLMRIVNVSTNDLSAMDYRLEIARPALLSAKLTPLIDSSDRQKLISIIDDYLYERDHTGTYNPEPAYKKLLFYIKQLFPIQSQAVNPYTGMQEKRATQSRPQREPITSSHGERKKKFIEATEQRLDAARRPTEEIEKIAYYLPASDLPAITAYYKQKGVTIYINGETPGSEQKIAESINKTMANLINPDTALIELFNSNNSKNISFLAPKFISSKHYSDSFDEIFTLKKEEELREIFLKEGYLKKGVSNNLIFMPPTTPEQSERFNQILFQHDITAEKLSDIIKAYAKFIEETKSNMGLPKKDCIEEVEIIRRGLKNGEAVGYIYTNQQRLDQEHFEVLVITPDAIIKPVHWAGVGEHLSINIKDFPGLVYTPIGNNIVDCLADTEMLCPQAGTLECGTIGILYLNRLLKNDAAELKNESLCFTYYTSSGNKEQFFFPSPEPLRYSQSTSYNRVIAAMLTEADSASVKITHHGKKVEANVVTLQKILSDSIAIARSKGDESTAVANQAILDRMPDFCDKWMEGYRYGQVKREDMEVLNFESINPYTPDKRIIPRNMFLPYKTQQMKEKAHQEGSTAKLMGELDIQTMSENKEAEKPTPSSSAQKPEADDSKKVILREGPPPGINNEKLEVKPKR